LGTKELKEVFIEAFLAPTIQNLYWITCQIFIYLPKIDDDEWMSMKMNNNELISLKKRMMMDEN